MIYIFFKYIDLLISTTLELGLMQTSPHGETPPHGDLDTQVSVRRSGRKVAPVDLAAPRKDEVSDFS